MMPLMPLSSDLRLRGPACCLIMLSCISGSAPTRESRAAKQAADPRAIAEAKRIEQARVAYQQQLQAQELQIFNALVEVLSTLPTSIR